MNHIFVLLSSIFFILSFAIYSVLCLQLIQPIGCHTNKIIIIKPYQQEEHEERV